MKFMSNPFDWERKNDVLKSCATIGAKRHEVFTNRYVTDDVYLKFLKYTSCIVLYKPFYSKYIHWRGLGVRLGIRFFTVRAYSNEKSVYFSLTWVRGLP